MKRLLGAVEESPGVWRAFRLNWEEMKHNFRGGGGNISLAKAAGVLTLLEETREVELRVQIRSRFAIFAMAECGSEASRAVLEPVLLARYGAGDAYR